jgi:thiol-disulfide isomerase/thioredoxin
MKRRTLLRSLSLLAGAAVAGPARVGAATPADSAVSELLAQAYPDADGRSQPLAQWKGRPMLINFWATWCGPCVKEMPELDALHSQHPDVQFLGIAIDTPPNVVKFLSKIPVKYQVLVAGTGGIGLMRKLGNGPGALPFTIVLGADGRIKKQILGAVEIAALGGVLADVAAEPQ